MTTQLKMPKLPLWMGLLMLFYGIVAEAQTVTNVRAEQEQSDIVVAYDLEAKEPCNIEVYVSPDGGRTWQGPLVNLRRVQNEKCEWLA
jgi:hypothetical protein